MTGATNAAGGDDRAGRRGPAVLAGRYELAEPLGSGGMSRVVAAHDRLLGRRVAVKLLRDDLAADPAVRARLLREARAAASFAHPNAVAVYDVGEDGDRPFIVMELVDGRPLTEVLRERGSLPADEAVRIAVGMLAALAAAHARGLVHRDVKPGNILLDRHGDVKLADFGIAKGIAEATAGLTATGQVVGTPRYLSPEQAAGAPADARSDLYAAGVVCYEMLAGSPPFTGHHALAIAIAHQREPVPPLVDARPDVPPALAAAVHRALEKAPADRFAHAGEMQQALQHAVDTEGTTAVLPVAPAGLGAQGTVAPADAPTAVPRPGRDAARWAWPAVAIVALALLAYVVLTDVLDGGGAAGDPPADGGTAPEAAGGDLPDDGAEPGAEGEDPAGPTPTPTPTPTPVDARGEVVAVVTEMFRELREDDERFGEKGRDLLDKLEQVLDEDDRRTQASDARSLMDDIEKWVDEGELDAEIGAEAMRVLEDFVRAQREADWGAG